MNDAIVCGRTYVFDSAHRIVGHAKCGEVHGHTWKLTVVVGGKLNEETGMLIDFNELNTIVRKHINTIDHLMINDVVDIPVITAETLCRWFCNLLLADLDFEEVAWLRCRLQEGEGGWAEYTKVRGG
jgi:6-pyruvoyltetrahydropterin/6-carboxytetrahydropterin synthase